MTARRTLLLPFLLLALGLGACGSDDSAPTTTSGTDAAGAGQFPATVEHKYGKTTLEEAPQRVVVVGLREQDPLLALGVAPVATTEWYGEDPGALEPWAREKLGDRPLPTVLPSTDNIDVERVARQRPDLIVGIDSPMTQRQYDLLSKLAPTVAPPVDTVDYASSWQQQLQMLGDVLGKREQADELRADVESKIRDVAGAHPDWKGKTAVNATLSDGGGFYVYGPKTAYAQLLRQLGFAYPSGLADIGGDDGFGGVLSGERVDLLDVDLMLWDQSEASPRKQIVADPIYSRLAVHREGREVFQVQSSTLYDALSKTSVLSVPVALRELPPLYEKALAGEPQTSGD